MKINRIYEADAEYEIKEWIEMSYRSCTSFHTKKFSLITVGFKVFDWTLSLFSNNLNVRRYYFGVWRLLSVGIRLCSVRLKFTDFWRHLLLPSLICRQQVHPKRPFGPLNCRKNMYSQTWSFTFRDINCCFTFFRITSSVLLNTVGLS